MRGAGFECGRGNAPRKIRKQQATGQFQGNLHIADGGVISDSKQPEATGQEERIAGEPDQRLVDHAVRIGDGELAVQDQVPGHAAVEQRIDGYLWKSFEHPKTHDSAAG